MRSKLQVSKQNLKWRIALTILMPVTFIEFYLAFIMMGAVISLGLLALPVYLLYFMSGLVFPWKLTYTRMAIGIGLVIVATGIMLYGAKLELIESWSGSLNYFPMVSGILFGFLTGLIVSTYRFLLPRVGILGKNGFGFQAEG
jgi:hypothetical protein